jgi:hypothetical protein
VSNADARRRDQRRHPAGFDRRLDTPPSIHECGAYGSSEIDVSAVADVLEGRDLRLGRVAGRKLAAWPGFRRKRPDPTSKGGEP